jgi:hypothetical protein
MTVTVRTKDVAQFVCKIGSKTEATVEGVWLSEKTNNAEYEQLV